MTEPVPVVPTEKTLGASVDEQVAAGKDAAAVAGEKLSNAGDNIKKTTGNVVEQVTERAGNVIDKGADLAKQVDEGAGGFFSKNKGLLLGGVAALLAFNMAEGGILGWLFAGIVALGGMLFDDNGIASGLFSKSEPTHAAGQARAIDGNGQGVKLAPAVTAPSNDKTNVVAENAATTPPEIVSAPPINTKVSLLAEDGKERHSFFISPKGEVSAEKTANSMFVEGYINQAKGFIPTAVAMLDTNGNLPVNRLDNKIQLVAASPNTSFPITTDADGQKNINIETSTVTPLLEAASLGFAKHQQLEAALDKKITQDKAMALKTTPELTVNGIEEHLSGKMVNATLLTGVDGKEVKYQVIGTLEKEKGLLGESTNLKVTDVVQELPEGKVKSIEIQPFTVKYDETVKLNDSLKGSELAKAINTGINEHSIKDVTTVNRGDNFKPLPAAASLKPEQQVALNSQR